MLLPDEINGVNINLSIILTHCCLSVWPFIFVNSM